jgi:hypothetical protein
MAKAAPPSNHLKSQYEHVTAAEIAEALGFVGRPRQTSRGLTRRVRCPSHNDRHPSLDITDANGRVLLYCQSRHCTQAEIIGALRKRGLWHTSHRPITRKPVFRWDHHLTPGVPFVPAGPDRDFERAMMAADIRGYFLEAAQEIVELYRGAGYPLDANALHRELNLALECIGADAHLVGPAIIQIVAEAVGLTI